MNEIRAMRTVSMREKLVFRVVLDAYGDSIYRGAVTILRQVGYRREKRVLFLRGGVGHRNMENGRRSLW
jgi:hypothetical protein